MIEHFYVIPFLFRLVFNTDLQVALSNHKLDLNADKTKFMLFTRAKNIDYDNLIISI